MRKSRNNCLVHVNSQVIDVLDLYSILAEDLETVVYFLLYQIRALPKKTQQPITDYHVVIHHPQSASHNLIKLKSLLEENSNPCSGEPFKYVSTQ